MRALDEHLNGLGLCSGHGAVRYMPEMTNLQVREYMEGGGRTVIVPVGSTEDHGDHGPLWTDVYIPIEVAKRAAEELDALVGPPVPFGLAPDHRGASGLVYVRLETFVALLSGTSASRSPRPASSGSCSLNGHYVNSWAMQYAAAEIFDELPQGVRVYPFAYWQGLKPEQAEPYLSGAPASTRTSARRPRCWRSTPTSATWSACATSSGLEASFTNHPLALLDPIFLATPGSFWSLLEEAAASGAIRASRRSRRASSSSSGAPTSVVNLVRDMETMHDQIEPYAASVPAVTGVAILGAGLHGAAHAANYAALGDRVRVKGVAAPSERAANVADLVGAELTDGSRGRLLDSEVDTVDVCLPTPLHRELPTGVSPPASTSSWRSRSPLTADDADAIVAVAERNGRAPRGRPRPALLAGVRRAAAACRGRRASGACSRCPRSG